MSQQPRYQVIERIDAGGMAEVFKANSASVHGFQKLVAIKRILPDLTKNQRFIRMFLDEAKVSLFLNHTNCVQVFELGIADGTYFIVMEYVNGTTLKYIIEELAQQGTPMPVEHAVYMCLEICKGLWHAHTKHDQNGQALNIIHRDISPPNVLVSREGEVKITDFGLAKAQSQVETTDPGVVKGKFGYLSPEAAHGEPIDQRTDVFATGILLWEMLMGRRLFLGRTDYDTLRQVQAAQFTPVGRARRDVPPELDAIIAKALTRHPHDRYNDAREMAQALATFLFAYGRPVTAFDIAVHVQRAMAKREAVRASHKDSGVNEAVQRELDGLVALEEIDDLDLYLAQHAASSMSDENGPRRDDGLYEDPRDWADFGSSTFDDRDEEFPMGLSGAHGIGEEPSSAWQQTELEELARPSGSNPAVDLSNLGPGASVGENDPTRQMSRDQVNTLRGEPQQPGGGHTFGGQPAGGVAGGVALGAAGGGFGSQPAQAAQPVQPVQPAQPQHPHQAPALQPVRQVVKPYEHGKPERSIPLAAIAAIVLVLLLAIGGAVYVTMFMNA